MAKKINILILEDDEDRIKQFKERFFSLFNGKDKNLIISVIEYARTAKEAIEFLKKTTHYDIIFLDHDLGNRVFVSSDDENTGSEVVRYLVENANHYTNTKFIIHSFNPLGAKNMLNNIKENITDNVIHVPAIWTRDVFPIYIRIK